MLAQAGRIRSGGDGAALGGMQSEGAPPIQKNVSLFSGIVKVDGEGKATLNFDVPSFTGNLKLMSVAWSKDRTGHSISNTLVRDAVIMMGATPRFLSVGDVSRLHIDLQNTEGKPGNYTLLVEGNEQIHVTTATGKSRFSQSFPLTATGKQVLQVPLKAMRIGEGLVTATLSGPDGLHIAKAYQFPVRPAYPGITSRISTQIKPGGFVNVSQDLLTNMVPGTGKVTLSVAPASLPDIPGLLMALDKYPYGCSEQITSRAMPLLYLSSVAEHIGMSRKRDKNIKARLQTAIDTLFTRQGSEGDFGLWNPGSGDLWLSSYVMDFLGRARKEGYHVPTAGYENGLRYIKNALSYNTDLNKGGKNLAYSLYILSLNKKARLGDLRYYADEKLAHFTSPLAKAHLAASLAMYGDTVRSSKIFSDAVGVLQKPQKEAPFFYGTYGSDLRDSAALLTLVSETGQSAGKPQVSGLAEIIRTIRNKKTYTTTQEQAWLLMAANAVLEETKGFKLTVNGLASDGPLHATLNEADLQGATTRIDNHGSSDVRMSMNVFGSPLTPEAAVSNGFEIERLYYTLDGKPVNSTVVRQNTRLVSVLKVHIKEKKPGEIMIADYLPAGFEIDNPRLVKTDNTDQLSWLPRLSKPTHTEFRDHRFTAAFSMKSNSRQDVLTLAYIVRAVSPGSYTRPPAIVEDMYRPERTARTESEAVIIN